MAKNYFNRYVWLIDLIYRWGHITMDEINRQWSRSSLNENGEKEIPERTFFNHKKAIEDVFGISIKCNRTLGYYIENTEDVMGGRLKEWMLQSLSLNNLVNESSDMRDRILMEPVPSSQKWLTDIINAVRDGFTLEITYQSFRHSEPATFEIEPYCLKMFRQRWYVLGRSVNYQEPRIYALDRIRDLYVTENSFSLPESFNASEYFSNIYGVSIYNNAEVCDVKIKAEAFQANYLRTLPLHNSQKETERTDEYSIFTFKMVPTFEFEHEMLSLGRNVEILEPLWLRDEIAAEIMDMASKY